MRILWPLLPAFQCPTFKHFSRGNASRGGFVALLCLPALPLTFRLYDFHYHTGPHSSTVIPGRVMTFSGYPGRLFSGDDFYITSAGLVIQVGEARMKPYNIS